jgi:hypothetical protein
MNIYLFISKCKREYHIDTGIVYNVLESIIFLMFLKTERLKIGVDKKYKIIKCSNYTKIQKHPSK